MKLLLGIVLSLALFTPSQCWDSVEMEVFDVVEEVNQNFYELMGITQEATVSDVKKAYRTLSKQIHPDKSDAPDADVQFRMLVAVYEVLKDTERRGHYDRVLVDGLPDWRSAVYYYRRARKMSMLEITLILTVVISLAQYLMAWGSYFDKWKTVDDAISRKFRNRTKLKKKGGGGGGGGDSAQDLIDEAFAQIPKPSMWNILPVQICRGLYYLVLHGPSLVRGYREERDRREREKEDQARREEEEELLIKKEEEERKARKAAPKRRKQVVGADAPRSTVKGVTVQHHVQDYDDEPAAAGYTTGMWSQEEFCELAKLMTKHPGGTVDRWDVISEQLNRAPHEVTKMAVKMKDRLAAGTWLQEQEENLQTKLKTKTRAAENSSNTSSDSHWSAVQQKALEKAIKSFPKGTDQRWDKIAKQVPEKTNEDCISRFKFLVEKIRKKKEEDDSAAQMATQRFEEHPDGAQDDGAEDDSSEDANSQHSGR